MQLLVQGNIRRDIRGGNLATLRFRFGRRIRSVIGAIFVKAELTLVCEIGEPDAGPNASVGIIRVELKEGGMPVSRASSIAPASYASME